MFEDGLPFGQAGDVGEDCSRVGGELLGLILDIEVSGEDLSRAAGIDQEIGGKSFSLNAG